MPAISVGRAVQSCPLYFRDFSSPRGLAGTRPGAIYHHLLLLPPFKHHPPWRLINRASTTSWHHCHCMDLNGTDDHDDEYDDNNGSEKLTGWYPSRLTKSTSSTQQNQFKTLSPCGSEIRVMMMTMMMMVLNYHAEIHQDWLTAPLQNNGFS